MDSLKAEFRNGLKNELQTFLKSNHRIALPCLDVPVVSIVVVTWNQAELTYACLRGLEKNVSVPFELILVDNASTDETKTLLSRLEGATVVHNDDNVGFLLAVNAGGKLAKGKYILLLNNDAIIRKGSLEAAVSTLESDDSIGAVGGPIVLLDGTLQEAGSIIWQDGTCLGYGRGRNRDEPEFRFRRDVDYCSGAFLLIKGSTWAELDGFDETFAPAYYEETDLCMRIRGADQRVVYEPNAVIDHYEFGSATKSDWALALQQKHYRLFQAKHQNALKNHFLPSPENVLYARTSKRNVKRVLVVDDVVPQQHLGAGYPRAVEIAKTLVDLRYEVTYFPMVYFHDQYENVYKSVPTTMECMIGEGSTKIIDFLTARRDYYDVIFVSRPHNMHPIDASIAIDPTFLGKSKLIYDAEAVFAAREVLKSSILGTPLPSETANDMIAAEVGLARFADAIITVSSREASIFGEYGNRHAEVLGHSISLRPTTKQWRDRNSVVFVGRLAELSSPNTDSITWFSEHVFPRVQKQLGNIEFRIAGKNDAATVQDLPKSNPSIKLLGMIPDLTALYDDAKVVIAPTRFAGGIPHKVHEAAAHGVPVVATKLIAEQLGWRSGEAILATDDASSFADSIVRLYREEELWNSLRDTALKHVAMECTAQAFRDKLETVLSSTLNGTIRSI